MERLHIVFTGSSNCGKSSLINALAGQEVSLVSPVPGTTTDPVRKVIELPGIGPCVLIDTAGFDDVSVLGGERRRLTEHVLETADIIVAFRTSPDSGRRDGFGGVIGTDVPDFGTSGIPVIEVMSKSDLGAPVPEGVLPVSSVTGEGIPELLKRLTEVAPKREERRLTGNLAGPGDTVVLVMPQDSEAPKGRLILPQVQVIRALLDEGCIPVCCQPSGLQAALDGLRKLPDLVITDSQVFKAVDAAIPAECPLTSFSVLLAAAKGDIRVFVEGARAIDRLRPGDRVLIAEACTHVPDTEDIGRVKIPALLRRRVAQIPDQVRNDGLEVREDGLKIDIAAGNDFPEDLSPYSLIIHCGACVATAALVRARTRKALLAGVPITNYGLAIAHLQGILSRISLP